MNQIPRSFAGYNNEFATFLQENISCPKEGGFTGTARDSSQSRHRAGHDNHGVEMSRAANEWNIQVVLGMLSDLLGHIEFPKLLDCNLFGVGTHDQMHLVDGCVDLIKQPLKINRAAGASCANHQFHRAKNYT